MSEANIKTMFDTSDYELGLKQQASAVLAQRQHVLGHNTPTGIKLAMALPNTARRAASPGPDEQVQNERPLSPREAARRVASPGLNEQVEDKRPLSLRKARTNAQEPTVHYHISNDACIASGCGCLQISTRHEHATREDPSREKHSTPPGPEQPTRHEHTTRKGHDEQVDEQPQIGTTVQQEALNCAAAPQLSVVLPLTPPTTTSPSAARSVELCRRSSALCPARSVELRRRSSALLGIDDRLLKTSNGLHKAKPRVLDLLLEEDSD
eukprot:gene1912-33325_t